MLQVKRTWLYQLHYLAFFLESCSPAAVGQFASVAKYAHSSRTASQNQGRRFPLWCSCDALDGCGSAQSAGAARRLSVAPLERALSCCRICMRAAHSIATSMPETPAVRFPRTVHTRALALRTVAAAAHSGRRTYRAEIAAPTDVAGNATMTTGVIVVDHGSRRATSNDALLRFVEAYRSSHPTRAIVEAAHMELAAPSIADAFTACVSQGATRIVVSPLFLFHGRHVQEDIPELVAEAAQSHPGIEYAIAEPIGMHPLVAQALDAQLEDTLQSLPSAASSTLDFAAKQRMRNVSFQQFVWCVAVTATASSAAAVLALLLAARRRCNAAGRVPFLG